MLGFFENVDVQALKNITATGSHTGVEVQVYAYGPGPEMFVGLHDNTDLPKLMAKSNEIKISKRIIVFL